MKLFGLSVFFIKLLLFFKKSSFLDFRSIEIAIKIFGLSLPDSIDVRSILDRSKLKIFSFFVFFTKIFYASFMFRIHMYCIVFCIHLAVLQSYLSLFSHITCIHFATLGKIGRASCRERV